MVDDTMAAGVRRWELTKCALPTGPLKRREVFPAVGKRVQWITFAVKPDRLPGIASTASKELLVDHGCGRPSGSQPTANEVDNAFALLRVLSGVGNAQDTSPRLPADDDAVAVDEGESEDCLHRRLNVA